jgi:hypothetical protein
LARSVSDETNHKPSDAAEFLEADLPKYPNGKWMINGKLVDMNALEDSFKPRDPEASEPKPTE